jgi:hypothetical protein
MEFEAEVRRVAEAVWRLEPGECQPAWYRDDPVLRELDGIARLRDITHLLMATTQTKLDKAISDIEKLNAAATKEERRGFPAEKWLITRTVLNAEHLEHGRKNRVKVLTLEQFRRRFFDGRDYIAKRRVAAFGSARNLQDHTISIPEDEYVELPMSVETIANGRSLSAPSPVSLDEIVTRINGGNTVVVIGPFGAGKSLTTREVFLRMARGYLKDANSNAPVPIVINLREHWGADYADEVLERHARSIGFTPRENLTIAWRAGVAALLIDGFDEVASQTVSRPDDRHFMRRARFDALTAVRDLVSKLPSGSGLLLCGRDHYFDNASELLQALGLGNRQVAVVRLAEFSEEQASKFLRKHSRRSTIPDWLPRKPLILGYLAHQGLLDEVLKIDSSGGFGLIWDKFLDMGLLARGGTRPRGDGSRVIRRVLERLACIARSTSSGTGTIERA